MNNTTSFGSMRFQTEALDHDIHYGQIRYCKLEGIKNSSLHKTRPCLIIQKDISMGNKVAVIPLTSEPEIVKDGSGVILSLEMKYEYKENRISYIYPEGMIFVDRSRIDCYICQCPQGLLKSIKQYLSLKLN